jgi:metalloendopeptidase OMA1, mitochondrial
MQRDRTLIRLLPILIAVVVVLFQRCSAEKVTNDAGRSARLGLKPEQEKALGVQAFNEVLTSSRVIQSGADFEMVQRCAARLSRASGEWANKFQWKVALVESPQVNAFCLPGGKICVYTGILPVAKSETGLAVVMGHEIAHATLRHGSERMLDQQSVSTLLTGVNFSLGDVSYGQRQAIMGVLGAGAQYGVLNPFSRNHESEADSIGLRYMALAGYDPREAINFWQRMGAASKGAPSEFLSTHPSHETRIQRLKDEMPKALELYQQATGGRVDLERR